ncbi:MAG: hypothetical protein DRJ03_30935 [Chloroflexi bacterium]|nr:MAG: hypothetical protein DRJ03_30935 [Chloroflexota bacterium]
MTMKAGLLWFDDDPDRTLEDKVLRAAKRYRRKYDRQPNLCFVHPAAFEGLPVGRQGNGKVRKAGQVEIRPGHSILPHHFWIGVDEESDSRAQSGSLVARVEAEGTKMTPERARQMVMELEGAQRRCART